MAEPVRIPIEVDVSQMRAQLEAVGAYERQRATRPTEAGGVNVGTINRELQSLEGGLRGLNLQIDRLVRTMGGAPSASGVTSGGITPPAAWGRRAPGMSPDAEDLDRYMDRETRRMERDLARMERADYQRQRRRVLEEANDAAAARAQMLTALSVGIGTFGYQVRQWGQSTADVDRETLMATLASGGGSGDYAGLRELATRPGGPGFRSPVDPSTLLRGSAALGRVGFPRAGLGDASAMLSTFGFVSGIGPEAGAQLGAEAYRTARSDRVPEYLATLVRLGEREGVAVAELAQQAGGLFQVLRQTQGQYARTPDELERGLSLQRYLTELPGGMGRGQGGLDIVQGMSGFMGSPFGRAVAMRSWLESGHRMPRSLREGLEFEEFAQDITRTGQFARGARGALGEDVFAALLAQGGMPLAAARRYARDPSGGGAGDERLLGEGAAGETLQDRIDALLSTPAGRRALADAERQRSVASTAAGRGSADLTTWWTENVAAPHPYVDASLKTLGNTAVSFALLRALGLGGPGIGGLGRTMASRGIAAARGIGNVGVVPLTGYGLAAKDAYDTWSGGDPTNTGDLAWGGTGAAVGATAGFFLGGPGLILPGAGIGYAGGRALQALFGASPAEAAVERFRGMAPDLGGPGVLYGHGGRVDPSSPAFGRAAGRYGLPPGLLQAIASVESSFDPRAVSPTGVRGLMQITGRTGAPYGLTDANRWDPGTQIDTSAQIMRDLLGQYGSLHGALSHYGDPNDPGYAMRVMSRMGQFGGGMSETGTAPASGVAHLFIHLDPDFPGTIRAQAPPGVTVHTTR